MNELILKETEQITDGVRLRVGAIQFDGFDGYMKQAQEIAAEVSSLQPTEDNLKYAKSMLASARKVSDGLNKVRIAVKKKMLEPYDDFEAKVKQLTAVIDAADEQVREQVRQLEEEERKVKRETIQSIWNERCQWYTLPQVLPNAFDLWMKPQYLNKTTTFKKAEQDMVKWLERTSRELATAQGMGQEYVDAYLRCLDLTAAIDSVKRTQEVRKAVNAVQGEDWATFRIKGKANIKLVEFLLDDAKIEYIKEEM